MNIDSIYVIVREISVGSIYFTYSRRRSKPVIDMYEDWGGSMELGVAL